MSKTWSQLEFLCRDHRSSCFYIPFSSPFFWSELKSKFYFWFLKKDIYKCPKWESQTKVCKKSSETDFKP
jgi:hypothetical protein